MFDSFMLLSRDFRHVASTSNQELLEATDVLTSLRDLAAFYGLHEITIESEITSNTLLIVVGGDGTALKAMKLSGLYGSKILAIHAGHLGFLSDNSLSEAQLALSNAIAGKLITDERMLLAYTVKDKTYLAGNEFGLADKYSGAFHYWKFYSQTFNTAAFSADSIMMATPTGSTAYSLSAGGAIMHPSTPAVHLSAVAPISLAFRPCVVPVPISGISIRGTARRAATLVLRADSQAISSATLKEGEAIDINIIPWKQNAIFLRKHSWSFFDTVSAKLGWGKVPGID
jgi:NAD+ kinase